MLPEVFFLTCSKVIVDLVFFKKLNVANVIASFILPKILCRGKEQDVLFGGDVEAAYYVNFKSNETNWEARNT